MSYGTGSLLYPSFYAYFFITLKTVFKVVRRQAVANS